MRYIIRSAVLAGILIAATPLSAVAHATPVSYSPEERSTLSSSPGEISIRFSERLEPSASSISLYPPGGGAALLPAQVDAEDPRHFVAPIDEALRDKDGVYTVSWQVVSSDDGHFTKGAFQFVVGTSSAPLAGVASVEVVHSSGYLEAATVAGKLVGESMLVGLLFVLFALGRIGGIPDDVRRRLEMCANRFLVTGGAILGASAIAYYSLKTVRLAEAQGVEFLTALERYSGTTGGEMTALLLLFVGVFFFFARGIVRRLLEGGMPSASHLVSFAALLLASYTQARLSHAAASHILPTFSVFMNIPHLLGKGLWIGGLLASVFVVFPAIAAGGGILPELRRALRRALGYATALAALFGGVSGAWIVWLHLKGWENITTTPWGSVFILLSGTAVILVALRLLALTVLDRIARCGPCERSYLFLEALIGLSVSFFSALIIITSPPLYYAPLYSAMTMEQGGMVHLSDPGSGQDVLRVNAWDNAMRPVDEAKATFTLENAKEGIGPIVLYPPARGGTYEIPASSFAPRGEWEIRTTFSREGAYDVNGRFTLRYPEDIDVRRTIASRPTWNSFSASMLALGFGTILLSVAILFLVRGNDEYARAHPEILGDIPATSFRAGILAALVAFVLLLASVFLVRDIIADDDAGVAAMHASHGM